MKNNDKWMKALSSELVSNHEEKPLASAVSRGSNLDNYRDVRIIDNKFGLGSWLQLGILRNVSLPKAKALIIKAEAIDVFICADNAFEK